MRRAVGVASMWVMAVTWAGCEVREVEPPGSTDLKAQSALVSEGYRHGMTWRVFEQRGLYVDMGADGQSNAYLGDTTTDTALPVLCLKQDGRAAPTGFTFTANNGWAAGEVKLTPAIPALVLTSPELADTMCAETFGPGWQMAEFHDGGGGWAYWAQGTLPTTSRFWVSINDQPANPWNSTGVIPPTPAPPKFFENENALPGRFIVMLPDSTAAQNVAALAQTLATAYSGTVEDTYPGLPGFTFLGVDAKARALSLDTRVDSVEQDSEGSAQQATSGVQQSPDWGLDRIDQRLRPVDYRYQYNTTAAGVNVYVLDTGLRRSHVEFEGRAIQAVDFVRIFGQREDCNGHGTSVASVIGGKTTGVAKAAKIISVRVAGCKGTAYNPAVSLVNSTLVAGMDWVARNHVKPAVANISYGSSPGFFRRWLNWKTPTDKAVLRAIQAGVTVVISAGNEDKDVERSSPGRLREAITVGATDQSDKRSQFSSGASNYGAGVDIFAPGSHILSADIGSDTSYSTGSGTSLAAPFVAGAAALYLQDHPLASPNEVATALYNNATPNLVVDPRGSVNRLLMTLPMVVRPQDVGVIAPATGCPANSPALQFNLDNEDKRASSYVSGWVGGTVMTGNSDTQLNFCRVDGVLFHSLLASSDSRSNYAVLKLGTQCPTGSVEFSRYFDNEDRNNLNSYLGNIAPNTMDGNTRMYFCLFRGGGTVALRLPSLGFEYGVFAEPGFAVAAATGLIHTDDEDTQNINGYSADPAWFSAATAIVSDGGNTDLHTAKAGFPLCGDGTCNGVESPVTCAADCHTVCGDNVCEAPETATSCAYDCGSCGDGVCGSGEQTWNCGIDCGYCGDGTCSPGESGFSCDVDCGYCGDGICGRNEDHWTCFNDC
ncbi:S8 family serine peptidase [Myxococcaceae bacterium JPH2]|nr:S8 family serine peptidase [Myxococcaceae bacterium JPH2]